MWTLLKGKILTTDNLKKKGCEGLSHCPMCQGSEENIQHLCFGCPFARACWKGLVSPLEVGILHSMPYKKFYQPQGKTIHIPSKIKKQ